MTQEDKQLVLQDLCARLPYGVKVTFAESSGREDCILNSQHLNSTYAIEYLGLKPYLRPMSSMTEEEYDELEELIRTEDSNLNLSETTARVTIDWLNKNMFDYRGLIPKGCAIAITEGNNPYK